MADVVKELLQQGEAAAARYRTRRFTPAETELVERVNADAVALYAEYYERLEAICSAADTPPEVAELGRIALSDLLNAERTDLFEIGYILGTREGLRVGIRLAQASNVERAAVLLKAMGDDCVWSSKSRPL